MHNETGVRRWSRRAMLRAAGGAVVALPVLMGAVRVASQAAPEPELLRMLAAMPDRPDFVSKGVTFANLGAAKRLYGFADTRTAADLPRRSVTDFTNAVSGCYTTGREQEYTQSGQYRDLFGYDFFAIDREIGTGQPPNALSRREGVFDPDAIAEKLRDGGYMPVDYRGVPYAAVRGDYALALNDPRSRLVLAQLNRVAYDRGRLIATSATNTMETALDAEAGRITTLAANSPFRALALALGDVTSVATLDAAASGPDPASVLSAVYREYLREQERGAVPLRPPLLRAMGYTDRGNDDRIMHAVRVYANPDDATADAPELERRITEHRLARTTQRLIPVYATGVFTRVETPEGFGVLVADIALSARPNGARLWLDMYLTRDTLFLESDPPTGP